MDICSRVFQLSSPYLLYISEEILIVKLCFQPCEHLVNILMHNFMLYNDNNVLADSEYKVLSETYLCFYLFIYHS